jgi:cytochrome c556
MDGMLNLGKATKALTNILSQPFPDPGEIRTTALTIGQHAGDTMTALFPEGSLDAPSQATPEIWIEWGEFASLADDLGRLALELQQAAADDPAVSDLIQPVSARKKPGGFWDALDEKSLLGITPEPDFSTVSSEANPQPTATASELFRRIIDTCASCHRQFRQGRS